MNDIIDLIEDDKEEDVVPPMAEYVKEVKERIIEDEYKREFTTDHIIDKSGFVDFLFIGEHNGEPVVWNACITTGKGDYFDTVDSKALDEAHEKYPSKSDPFGDESWVPYVPDDAEEGKWTAPDGEDGGYFQWVDPEPELSDKRYLWMSARIMELLASGTMAEPFWNVEIDEEYRWGVGLHIRIDVDGIELDDISNFITSFNEKGFDVFDDKDLTPRSMDADQLGVELCEDARFVTWKDFGNRNLAALNWDLDDDEESVQSVSDSPKDTE